MFIDTFSVYAVMFCCCIDSVECKSPENVMCVRSNSTVFLHTNERSNTPMCAHLENCKTDGYFIILRNHRGMTVSLIAVFIHDGSFL